MSTELATSPLLIGVGTRLGRDDETGLRLVEGLVEDGRAREDEVVLLEGADAAVVASVLLDSGRPALIVDAADMGAAPGTYRVFDEREARLKTRFDATSTHGLGLADGLLIARQLGFEMPIRVFAVQPFDLSPSMGLTSEMTALLPVLDEALGRAWASMAAGNEAGAPLC